MQLFINELISSIFTILVILLIPFIWWFKGSRKKINFFKWLGIKKIRCKDKKVLAISLLANIIYFLLTNILMPWITKGANDVVATNKFAHLGLKALPAIIIYALFSTAFWEECFFRGFLLKRLSNRFSFLLANNIQGFLFGLMHGLLFSSYVGLLKAFLITLIIGIAGWLFGYLDEKKANGSILPSMFIHFLTNLVTGIYSCL